MLDIEVAARSRPRRTIAVYFAPNTDKGFLDAITAAVHDTATSPRSISISWGAPEKRLDDAGLDSHSTRRSRPPPRWA